MPKPIFTPETKTVPLAALRLAAEPIEIGAAGDSSTVPVTVFGRSPQPVDHWFWGRIVHDFAGMKRAEKISLDYCHDDKEVLGFGDKFSVDESRGLVVAGSLTPFAKEDRASEIVHKSRLGVPYQGSIFFDPDGLVLEVVPEGFSTPVNGYQFEGPGVVAREWVLRGLAICPYGQDRNTAVEFSAHNSKEFEVKLMPATATKQTKLSEGQDEEKKEELAENEEQEEQATEETTEETTEQAEGEGDEEQAPTTVTCPNCSHEFEPPADEAEGEDSEVELDEEKTGDTKLSKKSGKAFIDAFGKQGAVWFAQGKTFEQAQVLFARKLRDRNTKLSKENKKLKARFSRKNGERDPVSFSNADTDRENGETAKAIPSLGKNLSKFAAGIKLPTRRK